MTTIHPEIAEQAPPSEPALRRRLRIFGNPLALVGGLIVGILIFAAFAAPYLAPESPYAQNLDMRLMPPDATHWLGTDQLGRDIFSRLLFGARTAAWVVLLVALLAAPVGMLVGAAAGYYGGWADVVLMRVTDIFLAFPRLILALALVAALGPGLENAIIAIALTAWPVYARVARAETLAIRNAPFIDAARMTGAGSWWIVRRQILPLCLESVIVRAAMDMAGVILTAAGLSFLGLGAQPPTADWGAMIADGRAYMLDHWWVAAVPGIAILITSLGFNLLGDGLRDRLDPKQ